MGKSILVDEQTLGFQGRHSSKLRITYKRKGNGFQYDALCDSGYTYNFYFHHTSPPAAYKNILLPLRSRVMSLFDRLEEKYPECDIDKLYMSAKFCKDAYDHPNNIKLHGITRKCGQGLPKSVLQEEVQNRVEQEKVQGTVLASELVGDLSCASLLAVSVYDTKSLHFLMMVADKIFWDENIGEIYDQTT